MSLPRADLESLLRTRRLDRTLTTSLPRVDPADEYALAATGITPLDAQLGGGIPRGHLSEIVGSRSSGRMSVLLQAAAAATRRGELVAFIDAVDMLDIGSASETGIDFAKLLWVRGHVTASPGACRDMNQRALEQSLRAFALVLQAGGFGLVVFDAGEVPSDALRRLPFTTWLRLQRMIEGSQTACVLAGREQVARSSAGLTIRLGCGGTEPLSRGESRQLPLDGQQAASAFDCRLSTVNCTAVDSATGDRDRRQSAGVRFRESLFNGFDVAARVVHARLRAREGEGARLATRPARYA